MPLSVAVDSGAASFKAESPSNPKSPSRTLVRHGSPGAKYQVEAPLAPAVVLVRSRGTSATDSDSAGTDSDATHAALRPLSVVDGAVCHSESDVSSMPHCAAACQDNISWQRCADEGDIDTDSDIDGGGAAASRCSAVGASVHVDDSARAVARSECPPPTPTTSPAPRAASNRSSFAGPPGASPPSPR